MWNAKHTAVDISVVFAFLIVTTESRTLLQSLRSRYLLCEVVSSFLNAYKMFKLLTFHSKSEALVKNRDDSTVWIVKMLTRWIIRLLFFFFFTWSCDVE